MTTIIGLSGKKQSGKSSLALYLQAFFELHLNKIPFLYHELTQSKDGTRVYFESELGKQTNWQEYQLNELGKISTRFQCPKSQVKIYSFADPIKEFCIDVLGVSHEQVYGTDDQKNVPTKYDWSTFPFSISNGRKGNMTARELMQVFGTDIMRNMFSQSVWVNACLRRIKKENPPIAIIADLRFPSELHPILDEGGYVVRLGRKLFEDNHPSETSLDDCNWASYKNVIVIGPEIDIYKKNEIVTEWILNIIEQKEVDNVGSSEQIQA